MPVALTWRLGVIRPTTAMNLYYAQASATAQYLYHADGGKHRAALFDMLRAYYTGDTEHLDISAAVGMTAAELGAAIEAFALAPGAAVGR